MLLFCKLVVHWLGLSWWLGGLKKHTVATYYFVYIRMYKYVDVCTYYYVDILFHMYVYLHTYIVSYIDKI